MKKRWDQAGFLFPGSISFSFQLLTVPLEVSMSNDFKVSWESLLVTIFDLIRVIVTSGYFEILP